MLSKVMDAAPGHFIELEDEKSIQLTMADGGGVKPQRYKVERVTVVADSQGLAIWRLIELSNAKREALLVSKTVDALVDFTVYYPTDFPKNTRKVNAEGSGEFLFENLNVSTLNDLRYVGDIKESKDDGTEVTYFRAEQGERTGKATENPSRLGVTPLLATVVEYVAEDGRQALVFEIGAATSEVGGLISLHTEGALISEHEVKVFKVG